MALGEVSARELADRVGISAKRLRDWLRHQAADGHPLLAGHGKYDRWIFSVNDANQLAAEITDSVDR
jgi:hypothetical protein